MECGNRLRCLQRFPEGHKHRVTTTENPRKILRTPAKPGETPQNPRRDPAEPSQSPMHDLLVDMVPFQERKRHININLFGRWPLRWPGGSPDREARGQSFMCYPQNPRNINLFVRIPDGEDRWPGRREKVLCAKVLCAFFAPYHLP